MKKLLTLFFALTCATSLFAYDCKVDGIYYNLNKKTMTAEVTNKTGNHRAKSYSGSIVIPSSISHKEKTYSVTTIGPEAFSCCSDLTSITIPNSVTIIGGSAFNACIHLTSVTIPNSVIVIGGGAFNACNLSSLIIPNSVSWIRYMAFSQCNHLTSLTILNPNVEIERSAFWSSTITDLYCGESVDLSEVGGTIKNIHRLSIEEFASKIPFDQYAKGFVEPRVNEWQIKGKYEKTTDWQTRVNETTRKQKIEEFYKEAQEKYLPDYTKRQSYHFTLDTYDPDNEVFLVKEDQRGDFLVSVPVADAEYVESNWSSCTSTPHYAFAGYEIIIESIDFTFPNNKTYTYKADQKLTYSTADINYNFEPIELPEMQTVTMGGAQHQAPQGITEVVITTPVALNSMSSVLVTYNNMFGKYEMPEKDEPFPYSVIRVSLKGDPKLVRLATQSLSLEMGQFYATEQMVPLDDKILFLVSSNVKNIFLKDGNGQRQLLFSGRLMPNKIYDGTVEVK